MVDYRAPIADIRFALTHIADLDGLTRFAEYAHADVDGVLAILDEFARFITDVVAPTNLAGDHIGAKRNSDGTVTTPPGFREAYAQYVKAGWGAVPFPPEFGGGGLPWVVAIATQELLTSANLSLSLCPLLTQGAIDAIAHHGSPEQQATYLPRMLTGEWTGTMNLTEPHAGSDVGALSTKAEPASDGTWRITGQKIFITFGEHDLAEQIVHLVLARTPGSPPGTKGISCFLVPKFLVNADGTLGDRNDVACVSIEHKLGIHGSPTCVMSYGDRGGAIGYLLGEERTGMRTMFTMMNNARLSVGLQGLAIGERAYQRAVGYAQQRLQGRTASAPPGASSPIIEHPDVRRMLLTMRSSVEAMRALVYLNAAAADRAKADPDPAERSRAKELLDLLTPITKGWCTDLGVEVASLGVQIHGGMGFIEETGAAQHYRDARIAPIYEGTNGIQAIDLVTRKLPMRGGAALTDLLDGCRATAKACETSPALAELAAPLGNALDAVDEASRWLGAALAGGALDDALAGATPYLRMLGTVLGGVLLAREAVAAAAVRDAGPEHVAGFADAKAVTARFYVHNLLGSGPALLPAVKAGAALLFELSAQALAEG